MENNMHNNILNMHTSKTKRQEKRLNFKMYNVYKENYFYIIIFQNQNENIFFACMIIYKFLWVPYFGPIKNMWKLRNWVKYSNNLSFPYQRYWVFKKLMSMNWQSCACGTFYYGIKIKWRI